VKTYDEIRGDYPKDHFGDYPKDHFVKLSMVAYCAQFDTLEDLKFDREMGRSSADNGRRFRKAITMKHYDDTTESMVRVWRAIHGEVKHGKEEEEQDSEEAKTQ